MSMMIAVGVLAVWRLAHLLYAEDGPWGLVARLRHAAGTGIFGQLLDCFYCLSLWVAFPVTLLLGVELTQLVVVWLALSGGAILLERITAPMPIFQEDRTEEVTNVVLRKDA